MKHEQDERRAAEWSKLEAAIKEYVEGYSMPGDNGEYTPPTEIKAVIYDCIAGLWDGEVLEALLHVYPIRSRFENPVESFKNRIKDLLVRHAPRSASTSDGWWMVFDREVRAVLDIKSKANVIGLVSCPFCGNTEPDFRGDISLYQIQCGGCGARGAAYRDHEGAKEHWNKRS